MFYQIQNVKIKRSNQLRVASKQGIFKAIRKAGWNIADCKITELKSELVKADYRGADGKTAPVRG